MKLILSLFLVCLFLVPTGIQAQDRLNEADDKGKVTQLETAVVQNPILSLNKWDYFLYPVPANDEINIKVTKGHAIIQQINIVDESGTEVMEIKDLVTDKIKLNISDLPPGKYFMQVRPDQDGEVKMKRFYVSN